MFNSFSLETAKALAATERELEAIAPADNAFNKLLLVKSVIFFSD